MLPDLARLLDLSPDGLLVLDDARRCRYANPSACELMGRTRDELIGQHLADYLPADQAEAVRAALEADAGAWSTSLDLPAEGTRTVEFRTRAATIEERRISVVTLRDVTAAHQRTHELSTLLDVAHNVASTLELRPLLGLILDQLHAVITYSGATILTHDGEGLTVLDYRGPIPRDEVVGLRFALGEAEGRVIQHKEAVILNDARGDTALSRAYAALRGRPRDHAFGYVRSWLAVPLMLKVRVIGIMTLVHGDPNHYTTHHAALAQAIAQQAAVAIENARLYEQAQEVAALHERQRLARELHDSVSQALYGIALGARTARTMVERDPAQAVEPLDYVLSLAEAGLTEMRALIFELRPEALEQEGLVAALGKQIAAVQARHGVTVRSRIGHEPAAPYTVKEALYRIAQEALNNTVKHAHAANAEVRLEQDAEGLHLEVDDDGIGFNPDGPFPGHLGLRTMRERAARLGGRLSVESAIGRGTRLRVSIPPPATPSDTDKADGAEE